MQQDLHNKWAKKGEMRDKIFEVSNLYEWDKWREEIPYINFPSDWQVKPVPPVTGAVVRFLVRRNDTRKGDRVSIYLDCYNLIGYYDGPYWEVYPHNGDVIRCGIKDVESLVKYIGESLEQIKEKKDD